MDGVSVIIKSHGEDLKNYIEALSPLLEQENSELIIISNSEEIVESRYDYTLYNFNNSYSKFKEFCFASSKYPSIIIIEDGIIITKDIINQLLEIMDDDFSNISCKFKKYLSNDKFLFFIHDATLLYKRGIKGFNRESGFVIEDLCLIKDDNMEANIYKVINNESYNELFKWYEVEISSLSEEKKSNFFSTLELIKRKFFFDNEKITKDFLNENYQSNYKNYLNIKSALITDAPLEYITNKIKEASFTSNDLYAAWIIEDSIKNKNSFFEIANSLGNNLEVFINYLYKNSPIFSILLYEFILDWENLNNSNLKLFLNIIAEYIKLVSFEQERRYARDKLLEVFKIYVKASSDFTHKGDVDSEFIKTLQLGMKTIDNGNYQDGISLLKASAKLKEDFSDVIGIYIQRLRYKINQYPYVLSICMIVKNEEKNLDRCLKSLKPLFNLNSCELIIVDTGSNDNTLGIARKYTDKVFIRNWQGNFSSSRNYSISLASGEYIFMLDADEEFKQDEIEKFIKEFFSLSSKDYNTYTFKLLNYTDCELTQYAVLTQPRIFKNTGMFYYTSAVHNQPIFKAPIKNLDIFIHHYGYIMTEEIKERKFIRTATLLKKELEREPKNIYYRFQLSTSYAMYGDTENALKHVELYMREIKELGHINESHLMYFNNAASIYLGNALYDRVIEICDEALIIKPDFIDFIFYKAFILFRNKDYSNAILYLNKYLDILDNFYLMDISSDGRYSFYTLGFKDEALKMLCISREMEEDYKGSIEAAFKIQEAEAFKNCIASIINSSMHLNEPSKIKKLYDRILKENNKDTLDIFKVLLKVGITKNYRSDINSSLIYIFGDIDDFIKPLEDSDFPSIDDYLFLASKYDLDILDSGFALIIFSRTLQELLKYSANDMDKVQYYRRLAQFILHRTNELKHFKRFSSNKLIEIFKKYLDLSTLMIKNSQGNKIDPKERQFLLIVSRALSKLASNDIEEFLKLTKKSIGIYPKLKDFIEMMAEVLSPKEDNIDNKEIDANAYSEELKVKLASLVKSGNTENLLEFFNTYNNDKLYDTQLFSIKFLLLLEASDYIKAEETLKMGLKVHPNDIKLLYNLSRLYGLTSREKECVENYSKARILELEFNTESLNNTIPIKKIEKEIKVLHGTLDSTDRTSKLVSALKDRGIKACSLNYYITNKPYNSDYVIDVNLIPSGSDILFFSTDVAAKLISQFDIFHFHYGTTLTFHHFDLVVLKELRKKVVMSFWGNDVRIPSIAKQLNPYAFLKNLNETSIKKNLEFLSNYTDICIAPDFEIYEYLKGYFNKIHVIPPMIDLRKCKASPLKKRMDKITIIHAPISPESKGTKYIISAIDELKKSYNIDFRIIQGVANNEALRIYRDADIIIDQLLMGSYGQLSIEAMALCKPVICYISDFMKDKYPKELPIISANPDNIKEELEYILKNRDMLYDIGIKGRNYVEKYHSFNNEVEKLINLYK